MDGLILIVLLLLGWAVIGPIIAIVSAGNARREAADAKQRADELMAQVLKLRRELREGRTTATEPPVPAVRRAAPAGPATPPLPSEPLPTSVPDATPAPVPPPIPEPMPVPVLAPVADIEPEEAAPQRQPATPPALVAKRAVPDRPAPAEPEVTPPEPGPPLNLEQFMGVKLFAWLGGVALFFGIIFFVKYAFENNLVSPAMQIALGYLTGVGVLAGGMVLHRRGTHPSLSHSFCATGILVIYGVTFAAYALERYQFLSQTGAFLLMALTTVAAFLIAVRLNALVVAVLGLAGGFLTPVMVATGKDELFILTVYVALLSGGLVAVSRHRSWRFLTSAAAAGALLHAVGWFADHFWPGGYGGGAAVLQPMGSLLLLQLVFLVAVWLERQSGGESRQEDFSAVLLLAAGWVFGFVLLGCPEVARRLELIYGWIMAQTVAVMVLTWLRPALLRAHLLAAGLFLAHLVFWFFGHFGAGGYGGGSRVLQPMGVILLFQALALGKVWWERRRGDEFPETSMTALVVLGAGWFFGLGLLGHEAVAARMELAFGWVAVQMAAVMALAWLRPGLLPAQLAATGLLFAHLAAWTGMYLNPGNLIPALALYLGFGAFTTVVPLFQLRRLPEDERPELPEKVWPWVALGPLLLVMLCLFNLPEPPLLVWALVLPANLLIAALAARTGSVLPVAGSLAVTLALAVAWLFTVPVAPGSLGPFLGITLGFALLFATLGVWLGRRMADAGDATERVVAGMLPVLAGGLPFGLLMLATLQLQPVPPAPVFGVALLLAALLLGLAVIGRVSALVPCAAAGVFLVQAVWHGTALDTVSPWLPLGWYGGSYLLFLLFPFVFARVFAGRVLPWISSALAGVAWFLLIHPLAKYSFQPAMDGKLGLVPLAFALPSLLALLRVVRMIGAMDAARRSRLAWFGGVALLFITLVFPIQFQRQWLTVSWALEGALLLWLFRRVPHRGLQLTGLVLLGTAFARLALNPAIWTDYARAATPIFNWYLYTYGLAALALFMGARWFSDPDDRLAPLRPRGVLFAMCGLLVFVLLNLEIADFFTPEGETRVSLGGPGHFARDMTYSIAWGLYALVLLVIGIWRGFRPVRYAAIGLLGITLLKLFLVDLAALKNIYRIGALIGVAVIAFIASFLYQQFFNRSNKP